MAIMMGIFGCSSAQPDVLKTELKSELDRLVSCEEIPGVTFVALFADGEMINLASGVSDKEKKTAMKPADIMLSASIGKNFVAAIALKLITQGKICLDDLVIQYFADEAWFKNVANSDLITIRMLLNHSTGIPRYAYKTKVWQDIKANPGKTFTGKERLEYILGDEPLHPAGSGWAYSDTNYIILGMIIEKVTGEQYYDLLLKQIIRPYHLSNTQPSDKRNIKGLVQGYSELGAPFEFSGCMVKDGLYAFNPQMEWTGGGVSTNVIDLVKWTKLLYSGDFLTQPELTLMTTEVGLQTDIPNGSYGFATIIWNKKGITSYGHTGFIPGYRSIVEYFPKYKLSLAMQVNTDTLPEGFEWDDALDRFFEIILKSDRLKQDT